MDIFLATQRLLLREGADFVPKLRAAEGRRIPRCWRVVLGRKHLCRPSEIDYACSIHNHANMSEAMEVAERPKMTAKQLWICAAWFASGMVLGQFTDTVLFTLWSKFAPLEPIPGWLDSLITRTSDVVLWIWFVLWISVPGWCVVAIVGILRGIFTHRNLFLHLLFFGLGFALFPLALYAYFHSELPVLDSVAQHTLSIAVVIFVGLFSHRLAHRKTKNSPPSNVLE